MKSLLIVGQPRSMSTLLAEICQKATGLKAPQAHRYEILNEDQKNCRIKSGPQYTKEDQWYQAHKNELLCHDQGYVIKDVIQPYSILRFLEEYPDRFNVLHIDRPQKECILHQWLRGEKFFKNLIIPGEWRDEYLRLPTVTWADVVWEPGKLWNLLESFGYDVDSFNYRTTRFWFKHQETDRKIQANDNQQTWDRIWSSGRVLWT